MALRASTMLLILPDRYSAIFSLVRLLADLRWTEPISGMATYAKNYIKLLHHMAKKPLSFCPPPPTTHPTPPRRPREYPNTPDRAVGRQSPVPPLTGAPVVRNSQWAHGFLNGACTAHIVQCLGGGCKSNERLLWVIGLGGGISASFSPGWVNTCWAIIHAPPPPLPSWII